MTRIDFYFNVEDKLHQVAQLAGQALSRQRRLLVFVPDAEAATQLEHALCTRMATDFLPCCRRDHALAAETPIVIDWQGVDFPHDDVLINLRLETPPFFSRFKGLVEIVGKDDGDRRDARGRFRFYRDRGYDIRSHDLAGG
ncbi:DNA polymerase III subunit chi [mine drainage metagenome]|uniref:DNA polymerase III subunit chi n=1 Tax=mine drainage metagenome TaxID=410659 RepID=A0A1J5R2P5_9ZZZZ